MTVRIWRVYAVAVVMGLVAVAPQSSAINARFVCDLGQKGKEVPCELSIVPLRFDRPIQRSSSADPVPLMEAGAFEVRADSPGYTNKNTTSYVVTPQDAASTATTEKTFRFSLTPGALVSAGEAKALAPHGAVSLVSMATGRSATLFLDREEGLVFPLGTAVGMILRGPRDILGVTAPFPVGGERTNLPGVLAPEAGKGHAAVSMQYPPSTPAAAKPLTVSLNLSGQRYLPTASTVATSEGALAVFYNVPEGSYDVGVESTEFSIVPTKVAIVAGRTIAENPIVLLPKPSLDLRVEWLRMEPAPVELRLLACPEIPGLDPSVVPDESQCKVLDAAAGEQHLFARLEPGPVTISAKTGGRLFASRVHLLPGVVERATLTVAATLLEGSVVRGDKPMEAIVTCTEGHTDLVAARATTDKWGRFRATIIGPGSFKLAVSALETRKLKSCTRNPSVFARKSE